MNVCLPHAALGDVLCLIIGRYRRFRVVGHSMEPLLSPDHEVLLDPVAYSCTLPEIGDIVVTYHPRQPDLRIIKRVEFVAPDGSCYLRGDNPAASTDSRRFGLIPLNKLIGKVVCFFP